MALWTLAEADVYFSPWVMRSAWNKTVRWYATGEWVDPAELLAWKADPWRHLAHLAEELSSGTYKPSAFPEIPYPKKGGYTRHYLVPSVRDQVAFNVFLVLLGPFLEARMPNVSFGNRLYRRRVLRYMRGAERPEGTVKKWYQAPFALTDDMMYSGFPSSYGLFRRMLQWLVNLCVLGNTGGDQGNEWSTEDPDRLPYLNQIKGRARGLELVHARLDMRMTYPTVDRNVLSTVMATLLANPSITAPEFGFSGNLPYSGMGRPDFPSLRNTNACFTSWIEPYRKHGAEHPWQLLAQMGAEETRLELCTQLCDAIRSIGYSPWETPEGWKDNVNDMRPCAECDTEQLGRCMDTADDNKYWLGPRGYAPLSSGLQSPSLPRIRGYPLD